MMKIILGIIAITFCSCEKDYNCYCSTATSEGYYIIHEPKLKAIKTCKNKEAEVEDIMQAEAKCHLE